MRAVGGIIAGVVAGLIAFLAIAYVGDLAFPLTTEIDADDPEQVTGAFSSAPLGAKLMLLAALFGAAFLGSLVAERISLRRWTAWPLAVLLTLFSVAVVFLVTLPHWMQIALVVIPLLGVLSAGHAVPGRGAAASEEAADAL
jgi:MFS family permease